MGKVLIIKQHHMAAIRFWKRKQGETKRHTCAALTPLSQQNCYTLGDILPRANVEVDQFCTRWCYTVSKKKTNVSIRGHHFINNAYDMPHMGSWNKYGMKFHWSIIIKIIKLAPLRVCHSYQTLVMANFIEDPPREPRIWDGEREEHPVSTSRAKRFKQPHWPIVFFGNW